MFEKLLNNSKKWVTVIEFLLVFKLSFKDNCNGWLTKIAEERGGDVSLVLDAMSNDPIYVKKMRLHGLI